MTPPHPSLPPFPFSFSLRLHKVTMINSITPTFFLFFCHINHGLKFGNDLNTLIIVEQEREEDSYYCSKKNFICNIIVFSIFIYIIIYNIVIRIIIKKNGYNISY